MLFGWVYPLSYGIQSSNRLARISPQHFLTFDSLELKKGDCVRIYTCKDEDHEETGPRTDRRYEVVYWNLDTTVWKEHASEVKLMKYGDSNTIGFD